MELWYSTLAWLNPQPYKWRRPFGKLLELYRCESDRRLLTDKMMKMGICGGHKILQPAYPTVFEMILIWTWLIR